MQMIDKLQAIVEDRQHNPKTGSYTNELLNSGMERIAQKVGEEGIETVVAALAQEDDRLLNEVADWVYHTTVLLVARGLSWEQVSHILEERHT